MADLNHHITEDGKILPFELCMPPEQNVPFVFASPHSGRNYPLRLLKLSELKPKVLRRSEDGYVDQLFARVPEMGAPLIKAHYPRAYVDLNRSANELDGDMFIEGLPQNKSSESERVQAGYGVIPRVVTLGHDIYSEKLDFEVEKTRLDHIYHPYHACLKMLLEKTRHKFGHATLIDCHSMPSQSSTPIFRLNRLALLKRKNAQKDPDIVLGDRFGKSCSAHLTHTLEELFLDLGYSVVRNDPYSGGYCTSHYGNPHQKYHAIQIEINRRLYLNEKDMKLKSGKTNKLKADLEAVVTELIKLKLEPVQSLAAE